ncbi:MAG: NnrS family protein [Deltaproteobacteria bacterium]|nr:NnrS family protein [Deltaproteobacteria bacterium]
MIQSSLVQLGETDVPGVRPVLLAKGFRPFFLLAAAYVALAILIWVFALGGMVDLGTYFGATYWHAHEMVFGFATAVIAGFLLTAVGNWTGMETAVGLRLGALVALWIIGRVAVLFAARLPHPLAAVLDLVFLPALAVACARPMLASANQRNYQFVGMLGALFLANLGMHLGALGVAPAWIRRGAWLGVDIVILMIVVMTARIVPMFTRNATRVESIHNLPTLDHLASAGMLALVVFDAAGVDERFAAVLATLVGTAVAARSATWGTQHTLRHPLLWVLHAGHAFVALGLVLRGVSFLVPALTPSAALHALTAGGIGMLTLGMMARVALGHTGRMLAVGKPMTLGFAALALAALLRVCGPLFGLQAYRPTVMTAGCLFALGFAVYVVVYLRILLAPRPDGKPG